MEIEQLKEKFIEEALSIIEELEESLLQQEEDLSSTAHIAHIFRVMHTLKGVSSMYGFERVSELAHDLETVLDKIRDGEQVFTREIFEVTLQTVDQFRALLADENLQDEAVKQNQEKLLLQIDAIVQEACVSVPSVAEKPSEEVDTTGLETFYIVFQPSEEMLFRGIRILSFFEELAEIGNYQIIRHFFNEEAEKESAWGIYCVTNKGLESIEDIFLFVLDDCRILKISNGDLLHHDQFIQNLEPYGTGDEAEESAAKIKEIVQDFNASQPEIKEDKGQGEVQADGVVDEAQLPCAEAVKYSTTDKISIQADKLDRLMYLVSELVTAKSELNTVVSQAKLDHPRLISLVEKVDDLARHFRDNALDIRLVAVSDMLTPFKRMVRDLAKSLGKEVKFITQGVETELDKNIIDRLAEPIMHLLRNCVDHGIETPEVREQQNKTRQGVIKFTSFYSGANVFIQIQDDGAGIDPEKIKAKAVRNGLLQAGDSLTEKEAYELLFHPGFSTAEVVSDVSGRGVGMDIVRKKIQEVRGEVHIDSEVGLGTFFTIKLHQTMSIIDTLLIQVDEASYLVPIADIDSCEQETHATLYKTKNRQVEVHGELIPFISLRDLFGHTPVYPLKERLVIIKKNEKRIALVADKIIGEHQAVLKPLGDVFQSQQYLSGASMLGDGSLALMLDINKVVDQQL